MPVECGWEWFSGDDFNLLRAGYPREVGRPRILDEAGKHCPLTQIDLVLPCSEELSVIAGCSIRLAQRAVRQGGSESIGH